jgi:ethanolamine utilization protein EutL
LEHNRQLLSVSIDIGTTTQSTSFHDTATLRQLFPPPLEGVIALDAALKAADVRIVSYTAPPSETNYMGVVLAGDQSACKAAAEAFQRIVLEIARNPIES